MTRMTKPLILAAALALAAPLYAQDGDLTPGLMLGKDEAAIRTALTDLGYEVRKIDMEDGKIEAYVVKDKYMAEIYVDAMTGEIVRVGSDD